VYFNVDFRYPPTHVIDVVSEALTAAPIEGVAEDPKPQVLCYDFAKDGRDSFAYYTVRYWQSDMMTGDATSSRIRARIYMALHRADIPLARPAQTVLFRPEEDDAVRARRHKERRVHALAAVDLFHTLTTDERAFVADHLRDAPFAAGETCTKQGAVAHYLYVLCAGTVEIRRHTDATHAPVVARIDAPGFFGEMGLMTGEPRTADVVAVTDVQCYRLDKAGLQRVLGERPEIAKQFSETLAKRRLDLTKALEGLDEQARGAKLESEQSRILDKIQEFFGLVRTGPA
jgi:CRP-like cAMP-binding protein